MRKFDNVIEINEKGINNFPYIVLICKIFINLFIWLHRVLVAARGRLSCGMQTLSCSMQTLSCSMHVGSRSLTRD